MIGRMGTFFGLYFFTVFADNFPAKFTVAAGALPE